MFSWLVPLIAYAQTATNVDWLSDATSTGYTGVAVGAVEDSFVQTFFYVITLIAPYAVILGVIWMAIRFFRRRG